MYIHIYILHFKKLIKLVNKRTRGQFPYSKAKTSEKKNNLG